MEELSVSDEGIEIEYKCKETLQAACAGLLADESIKWANLRPALYLQISLLEYQCHDDNTDDLDLYERVRTLVASFGDRAGNTEKAIIDSLSRAVDLRLDDNDNDNDIESSDFLRGCNELLDIGYDPRIGNKALETALKLLRYMITLPGATYADAEIRIMLAYVFQACGKSHECSPFAQKVIKIIYADESLDPSTLTEALPAMTQSDNIRIRFLGIIAALDDEQEKDPGKQSGLFYRDIDAKTYRGKGKQETLRLFLDGVISNANELFLLGCMLQVMDYSTTKSQTFQRLQQAFSSFCPLIGGEQVGSEKDVYYFQEAEDDQGMPAFLSLASIIHAFPSIFKRSMGADKVLEKGHFSKGHITQGKTLEKCVAGQPTKEHKAARVMLQIYYELVKEGSLPADVIKPAISRAAFAADCPDDELTAALRTLCKQWGISVAKSRQLPEQPSELADSIIRKFNLLPNDKGKLTPEQGLILLKLRVLAESGVEDALLADYVEFTLERLEGKNDGKCVGVVELLEYQLSKRQLVSEKSVVEDNVVELVEESKFITDTQFREQVGKCYEKLRLQKIDWTKLGYQARFLLEAAARKCYDVNGKADEVFELLTLMLQALSTHEGNDRELVLNGVSKVYNQMVARKNNALWEKRDNDGVEDFPYAEGVKKASFKNGETVLEKCRDLVTSVTDHSGELTILKYLTVLPANESTESMLIYALEQINSARENKGKKDDGLTYIVRQTLQQLKLESFDEINKYAEFHYAVLKLILELDKKQKAKSTKHSYDFYDGIDADTRRGKAKQEGLRGLLLDVLEHKAAADILFRMLEIIAASTKKSKMRETLSSRLTDLCSMFGGEEQSLTLKGFVTFDDNDPLSLFISVATLINAESNIFVRPMGLDKLKRGLTASAGNIFLGSSMLDMLAGKEESKKPADRNKVKESFIQLRCVFDLILDRVLPADMICKVIHTAWLANGIEGNNDSTILALSALNLKAGEEKLTPCEGDLQQELLAAFDKFYAQDSEAHPSDSEKNRSRSLSFKVLSRNSKSEGRPRSGSLVREKSSSEEFDLLKIRMAATYAWDSDRIMTYLSWVLVDLQDKFDKKSQYRSLYVALVNVFNEFAKGYGHDSIALDGSAAPTLGRGSRASVHSPFWSQVEEEGEGEGERRTSQLSFVSEDDLSDGDKVGKNKDEVSAGKPPENRGSFY